MKKHLSSVLLSIICICLLPAAVLPCTTFVLDNDGQPVYGKNMDWRFPVTAYVLVNKRGGAKTSMAVQEEPDSPQISWTSKYGSVTFNWFAREMPFEGINEAGLFVSTMGLSQDTEYPSPDTRTPIYGFQWVQYQLDNYSTVDEVIASDQIMRVLQSDQGAHYLVSDSKGNCASIEWLDGTMVCHTGQSMPHKVLANSTYDQSVAFLRLFSAFDGFLPLTHPVIYRGSLLRFAIAADMLQTFDPQTWGPALDYAFDILQDVEINSLTSSAVWSAVYDPSNNKIYFRSYDNDRTRQFDLSAFDFSCPTPVKALDVHAELEGDVTSSFVDYTEAMSRDMLESNFSYLPDEAIDYLATYPEKYTHCTE